MALTVLVNLHTRDAFVFNNCLVGIRKLDSIVSVGVGTGVGSAGTSFVIENTQVDGVSILLRAVGTNVVLSVPVFSSRGMD